MQIDFIVNNLPFELQFFELQAFYKYVLPIIITPITDPCFTFKNLLFRFMENLTGTKEIWKWRIQRGEIVNVWINSSPQLVISEIHACARTMRKNRWKRSTVQNFQWWIT